MVITGEKRRFKNMAEKEIFQSEEKIENKKKRDSKASFSFFSNWHFWLVHVKQPMRTVDKFEI